jgi:hypothetical protein
MYWLRNLLIKNAAPWFLELPSLNMKHEAISWGYNYLNTNLVLSISSEKHIRLSETGYKNVVFVSSWVIENKSLFL